MWRRPAIILVLLIILGRFFTVVAYRFFARGFSVRRSCILVLGDRADKFSMTSSCYRAVSRDRNDSTVVVGAFRVLRFIRV